MQVFERCHSKGFGCFQLVYLKTGATGKDLTTVVKECLQLLRYFKFVLVHNQWSALYALANQEDFNLVAHRHSEIGKPKSIPDCFRLVGIDYDSYLHSFSSAGLVILPVMALAAATAGLAK